MKTFEEKFWERVNRDGPVVRPDLGPCWVWTGTVGRKGYGQLRRGSRLAVVNLLAHRVSWEMAFGPIPRGDGYHGTCVLHRCDNPPCVNPSHLELGTIAQNNADMKAKRRSTIGSRNPNSKLNEQDVRAIRRMSADGIQREKIAAEFGIVPAYVQQICNRKTWRHVV